LYIFLLSVIRAGVSSGRGQRERIDKTEIRIYNEGVNFEIMVTDRDGTGKILGVAGRDRGHGSRYLLQNIGEI
jgi:hypothetical protein